MKLLIELLMLSIITANVTGATLTEDKKTKMQLYALAGVTTLVMVTKDEGVVEEAEEEE